MCTYFLLNHRFQLLYHITWCGYNYILHISIPCNCHSPEKQSKTWLSYSVSWDHVLRLFKDTDSHLHLGNCLGILTFLFKYHCSRVLGSGQNYLHHNSKMSSAFWTALVLAMVGKIALHFSTNEDTHQTAPDITMLFTTMYLQWRKKPVLVKNTSDWNENMHTACLRHTQALWASPGKALVRLVETWAKLTASFMQCHFYLKEWLTNYGYSGQSIWQTFSQKWIKWVCPFKENNWRYLLPRIKFEL